MFDMRSLSEAAHHMSMLSDRERRALELIGEGHSPHAVSHALTMEEPEVFQLVAAALDAIDPPVGPPLADVHALQGSRPATAEEIKEFEALHGVGLPADDEG